eukprot:3263835-Pleurochrysis_carterae.AAC.1
MLATLQPASDYMHGNWPLLDDSSKRLQDTCTSIRAIVYCMINVKPHHGIILGSFILDCQAMDDRVSTPARPAKQPSEPSRCCAIRVAVHGPCSAWVSDAVAEKTPTSRESHAGVAGTVRNPLTREMQMAWPEIV